MEPQKEKKQQLSKGWMDDSVLEQSPEEGRKALVNFVDKTFN